MESSGHDLDGSLAAVDDAIGSLAARISAPRWYHWGIGALVAQHVVVQGVDDRIWTLPSGALLVVGCAILWLAWRTHLGLTIGAWEGWRSALALGCRSLLALTCVWTAARWPQQGLVLGAAAVALVGSVWLGRRYDRAIAADLSRARLAPR
jgi:hypothetical protein